MTYVRVLRRRKWWVVFMTVLVLGASIVFAVLVPKQYTATADVLVQAGLSSEGVQGTVASSQLLTDEQLVQSAPVRAAVRKAINGAPPVAVSTAAQSNVITISATTGSPRRSATIANAYGHAFVAYDRSLQQQIVQTAENQFNARITTIQREIGAFKVQLKGLPSTSAESQVLNTQIAGLLGEVATLEGDTAQVVLQASTAIAGISVTPPAVPPSSPSSPHKANDAVIGFGVGLLLGLAAAFGIDSFDDSFKSRDELEEGFPDLRVLATVPKIKPWRVSAEPYLVSLLTPLSPAAESYRALRTSLQFVKLEFPLRSLLIASALPGEGKTVTTANLAVAFAKAGVQVLVVSCDLRRPRVGEFLGMSDDIGLASIALEMNTIDEAVRQVAEVPGLWYLGTGPVPPEPSGFLASGKVAQIFADLRERFDMVIIDTPPVLSVTDAIVLSRYFDAVAFVLSIGQTTRRSTHRLVEVFSQANARIVGVIVNQETRDTHSYSYYYGRYSNRKVARDPEGSDGSAAHLATTRAETGGGRESDIGLFRQETRES